MENIYLSRLKISAGLLFLSLLAACGGSGGGSDEQPDPPAEPVVTEISLQGYDVSEDFVEGQSRQLQAALEFDNGSTQPLSADSVTWASSAEAVASISAQGQISAVSAGPATITASASGFTASLDVVVVERELVELRFDPASASFALGTTFVVELFGVYNNDTQGQIDGTSGIELISSDPAVFVPDDAQFGRLLSSGVGAATLTARAASGVEAAANVEVGAATLTSIMLSPDAISQPAGVPIKVSALGTFSDGSQRDVSSDVEWNVEGLLGANVSATGSVSSNAPGVATVLAGLGGAGATLEVTFVAAALQSIEVLSGDGVVPLGRMLQLQVRGSFSNGSTALLSDAVWTIGDSSVAAISQDGLVTALAVGETDATATVNEFSDAATVRVSAAVLDAIQIGVSGLSNGGLPVGLQATASATGVYSDGSMEDLSNTVVWSFEPAAYATVSASGLITAVAPGVGQVSAAYLSLTDSAEVEVTPAVLGSVRISMDSLVGGQVSKAMGLAEPVSLVGGFSDGSETTVPFDQVTWTVIHPSVAAVGADGNLRFLSIGTTFLEARVSGFSDVITVITSEAIPLALAITSFPAELYVATREPLAAELLYSDDTRVDVTEDASWTSSDTSIARVLQGGGTPVRAEGVSSGVVDIGATRGVDGSIFSDSVIVTVLPSILVVECLNTSFFGAPEWSRCASSEGGAVISSSQTLTVNPRPDWFRLADFRLVAEGRDWVISSVSATNNSATVDVRVVGVATGTVIPRGETIPFVVEVQPTSGAQVINNITVDVIGNDGSVFRIITAAYTVATN